MRKVAYLDSDQKLVKTEASSKSKDFPCGVRPICMSFPRACEKVHLKKMYYLCEVYVYLGSFCCGSLL